MATDQTVGRPAPREPPEAQAELIMEKKELHTRDGRPLISVWIQLAGTNLVAGIHVSN